MDNNVAGGIISSAGSLASGIGGGIFSLIAQKRAYENQVKFWNMQNEYNTPSAQVNRLKEAGLNPALAYGQGGNVANTAGQLSTVPTASYLQNGGPSEAISNMFNVVGNIMALKKLQAETDNINKDTELKGSNIDVAGARTKLIQEQVESEKIARSLHSAMKDKTISEKQYIEARLEWQRIENNYSNATYEDRKALFTANLRSKQKQLDLTDKQIDDLESQIAFRDNTQTGYFGSMKNLNDLEYLVNNPDSDIRDANGLNSFERNVDLQNIQWDKIDAEIKAIQASTSLTEEQMSTKILDTIGRWIIPIVTVLLLKRPLGVGKAAAAGAASSVLYTPSKSIPYSSMP